MAGVFVIAEAGVNYNGSLEMAKELVDVAKNAGADAVKFQTFRAEALVSRHAKKAKYQVETTGAEESQLEMIKGLELSEAAHQELFEYCTQREIQFLSTPFDYESLDLLVHALDLPMLKIASGEITNAPLLLKMARTGKPIVMSTGMSTLGDIETALGVLAFGYTTTDAQPSVESFEAAFRTLDGQRILQEKVTLLHCTTEYPAPFHEVNLRAMDTLAQAFQLPVGYSDHTLGITVPIAAVARGATIVEKHFTLDRSLPGPDHRASLEPDELQAMVRGIRDVETALGSPQKAPSASEIENRAIARKSLVAKRPISEGDVFTVDNLGVKRPGTGVSPVKFWSWLGQRASRSYTIDEEIEG